MIKSFEKYVEMLKNLQRSFEITTAMLLLTAFKTKCNKVALVSRIGVRRRAAGIAALASNKKNSHQMCVNFIVYR